ncbi:Mg transporter [Trypanosoma conorhini]|uniref:Mg transporter n=1 Tax=Trypanosoma conorhini TaxID=83891 RepID=A0A422PAK6_9TRYP|nr:Mg transporter [Trypanosoma conorhini]RNF14747.1 Mg transporter [Trypanosoma conorhini]
MVSWLSLRGSSENIDGGNPSKYEKIGCATARDRGAAVRAREKDGCVGRGRITWAVIRRRFSCSSVAARCMPGELLERSTYTTAIKRFVLLAALLALQSGSQLVLQRHEELITNQVAIVLFMGMVVGAGGNAGNQAAVAVITAVLASSECSSGGGEAPLRSTECTIVDCSPSESGYPLSVLKSPHVSCNLRLSRWEVPVIRFPWFLRLKRLLPQWCGKALTTDGGGASKRRRRPVVLSLPAVLRHELIVAFFCSLILMCIGALRVILFLWLDAAGNSEAHPTRALKNVSSWPTVTQWSNGSVLVMALSLSLFFIVLTSVLIGATLPYVLDFIGVNIEHAAPIVQVVMDLLGTWLCCATCSALLPSRRMGDT